MEVLSKLAMYSNLNGSSRVIVFNNLSVFGSTQFACRNLKHIFGIHILIAREATHQDNKGQEDERKKKECNSIIGVFVLDINRVSRPANDLIGTSCGHSAPMTLRRHDGGKTDPYRNEILLGCRTQVFVAIRALTTVHWNDASETMRTIFEHCRTLHNKNSLFDTGIIRNRAGQEPKEPSDTNNDSPRPDDPQQKEQSSGTN